MVSVTSLRASAQLLLPRLTTSGKEDDPTLIFLSGPSWNSVAFVPSYFGTLNCD